MQACFKQQKLRIVSRLLCNATGPIAGGPCQTVSNVVILSVLTGAFDPELVRMLVAAGSYTLEVIYICAFAAESHGIPAPQLAQIG